MSSAQGDGSSSYAESLDQTIPGGFPPFGSAQPTQDTSYQTLQHAIFARRKEYSKQQEIRIKVGSWNVAACKETDLDVAEWFVFGKGIDETLGGLSLDGPSSYNEPRPIDDAEQERESIRDQEDRYEDNMKTPTVPKFDMSTLPAEDEIGLYVLGLQEVVDITSPAEALRPYTDPGPANKFKSALQHALPGYKLVAEQQLIGMLLLIYASPEVAHQVTSVSTTSVGTGLMGYMGNKGAVTTRLVLGETTRLVFINSHLAAGADKAALERRIWDYQQISTRTKFDAIPDPKGVPSAPQESLGEEDFAFWFGDLNYRLTGMAGDDIRRLLSLHIRNEYGVPPSHADIYGSIDTSDKPISPISTSTSSSLTGRFLSDEDDDDNSSDRSSLTDIPDDHMHPLDDPSSLQTTLASLLPHDELHQQQSLKKAFHDGWREGPIQFLPTYKYDVGSMGNFDSSEKKRCPSWCDRILYRTRKDKLAHEQKVKDAEAAKKKDEEMKAQGIDHAGDDESVLFDYNPEDDAADDYDDAAYPEPVPTSTKSGFEDEIFLEYYTSHQRVLSSDHKPLDAVFCLKYEAIDPELKAKVHSEVAKELDRAENEGRPSVTMIVEKSSSEDQTAEDDPNFEGVNFGDIRYAQVKHRTVTIANTGRVPATVTFVDRPGSEGESEGPCPPWLKVNFDREPDKKDAKAPAGLKDSYTLEPGDATNVELELRVAVMELLRSLNSTEVSKFDDILVLRVDGGRDHFLPLHGRWLQSSFAQTVDKLIKIPEGGIRKLQRQRPSSTSSDKSKDGSQQGVMWSAPRELFRLTESIEDLIERSVAEWDMTSAQDHEAAPWQKHASWPFVGDSWTLTDPDTRHELSLGVYEALDTDQPFDSAFPPEITPLGKLEILAQALLLFLSSLEDGIVTSDIWAKIEESLIAREKAKQVLPLDDERMWIMEILSTSSSHNVSFILVTTMLQRIVAEVTSSSSTKSGLPPTTPTHRKTLSVNPKVARKQIVRRSLGSVFAPVLIRGPDDKVIKDKERKAREERMVKILEIFIDDGSDVV